jgi:hypothetical protein
MYKTKLELLLIQDNILIVDLNLHSSPIIIRIIKLRRVIR